jgi:heme-degrading monooxygenase HmoA
MVTELLPTAPVSLPDPPYVAVIFVSYAQEGRDEELYAASLASMVQLARSTPGYLGMDASVSNLGSIAVAYFRDLESLAAFRDHPDHEPIQKLGREQFFKNYAFRVTEVRRSNSRDKGVQDAGVSTISNSGPPSEATRVDQHSPGEESRTTGS